MQKNNIFSTKNVFSLRNVIFMGIMAALSVLLDIFLSFNITPTFRAISFAYLPGVIVGIFYGPWAALAFGFVADTVKYFVRPEGAYFFGYALSEMLSYFLIAVFQYKRELKIWRIAAARFLVLIIIVFGMNYLWNYMMFGQIASKYYTIARVTNNIVQFPIHVALIYFLAKLVKKALPDITGQEHPR